MKPLQLVAIDGQWPHHCEQCRLLRSDHFYDFYICDGRHGPQPGTWLIVRFGSGLLDYTACRNEMAHNDLLERSQHYARMM